MFTVTNYPVKYNPMRKLIPLVFVLTGAFQSAFGQCPAVPTVTNATNSCSTPGSAKMSVQTLFPSCGTITHRWYTVPTGGTYVSGTYENAGTCAVYRTTMTVSINSVYYVSSYANGCESSRAMVTATMLDTAVPVLAVSPTLTLLGGKYTGNLICDGTGSVNTIFTASGGAPTSTYQWYSAATGGTLLYTGAQYAPTVTYSSTVSGVKTFYVGGTLTNDVGCSYSISPRRPVQVKLLPYSNTSANAGVDKTFLSSDAPVSLTPNTSAYSWSSPGAGVSGSTFTPSLAEAGVHSVNVRFTQTYSDTDVTCTTAPDEALYTVNGIVVSGGTCLSKDGSVQLTVTGSGYTSYQWSGPDGVINGATTNTVTVNKPGNYAVDVVVGGIPKTLTKNLKLCVDTQKGLNYIISAAARISGFTTSDALAIAPVSEVSDEVVYLDGLGRTVQKVNVQASPNKKDVVRPVVYDGYGRQLRDYLPVAPQAETSGSYKASIVNASGDYTGAAANFYNNPADKIADDVKPFSQTVVEPSPLNRIRKIGGFGLAWQPNLYPPSYSNYSQSWDYKDFTTPTTTGGGGVTATITNSVLTLSFSAGFTSSPLKLGAIKLIATTPLIYDMEVGLICSNNYKVLIKDGYVFIEKMTTTPVSVTGFSSTFTINLVAGGDYSLKFDNKLNAASEVLMWTYSFSTNLVEAGTASVPIYYPANRLMIDKRWDELGRVTMEYKNTKGQVVLKRAQVGSVQTPVNDTNYASTYYIYNDFGQLVCVIPPQATSLLATQYFQSTATGLSKESFLARWAFRYQYDAAGRMIKKWSPGAKPTYLVYDKRNRLVLRQDGNLRFTSNGVLKKEWLFIKYDKFDREIVTGLYVHALSDTSQAEMQVYVDSQIASGNQFYEDYSGAASTHGYTNRTFPTNGTIYTVSYFDSYDFIDPLFNAGNTSITTYDPVPSDISGQDAVNTTFLKGLLTGRKINILGTSVYQNNVEYYDLRYRPLQSIRDNHRGGTNRVTMKYDFLGNVVESKSTYLINSTTYSIQQFNSYDHSNRLLMTKHSVNGSTPVIVAKNEYSETGQLVDKQLHSRDNGVTFKQSIDYRYNIRGWLTKINESDVAAVAAGETLADYFGMELGYNAAVSGITASPAYNGNVAAIRWSSGVAGATNLQGFGYNYDALNRLLSSNHYKESLSGWAADNSNQETGLTYDLNGNITALTRTGDAAEAIDILSYGYSGNRLDYIHDTGTANKGFINGNTGTDDYAYDRNGNLIKDKNKGIANDNDIKYNFLNLPVEIVRGADKIRYAYDVLGNKLYQEVYTGTTLTKTTDYIGETVFENNALQFISHSEGRVIPDGANWEYQYYLKDHLGNVHVTFTEKVPTSVSVNATFETGTQTAEQGTFSNYSSIVYDLVDHTDAGTVSQKVQYLNGGVNGRVGLGKSYAVMPGDKVKAEVYAKYRNLGSTGNATSFISALAAAFGTSSSATGELGKLYNGLNSFAVSVPGGDHFNDSEAAPKAFITILLFDKNYNLVDATWDQIDVGANQTSGSVKTPPNHDYMVAEITVAEAGYAYVFLSNEHPTFVDVYFDDVTTTFTPSSIVAVNDYYPFGLTFNSYSRENSTQQNYLYNGKELQDELTVGWLDYGARMYMPDIGRWKVKDQYSTDYYSLSPYNYCLNNPINAIDPDGRNVYILMPDGSMILALRTDDDHEFYSYGKDQKMTKLDHISKDRTMIGMYLSENEDIMGTLKEGLSGEYRGSKGNTFRDYQRLVSMIEGTANKDAVLEFMVDMIGGGAVLDDLAGAFWKRAAKTKAAKTAIKAVGEFHHILSKKIVNALSKHPTLKGLFKREDPGWIFRALDDAAHKGYQKWHREYDEKVVKWLETNPEASREDFVKYINQLYQEPDLSQRIPNVKVK